jgi:hypothetical protein
MKDKFAYMTLRRGIRNETDAIAWCEEAIELLRQLEVNPHQQAQCGNN